jgi:deltex-like protein
VGLFVARLKGRTDTVWDKDPNTVLGRAGETDEVCVLGSSSQCVALVQFGSPMIELFDDNSAANCMVYAYHCELQTMIDDCFNGGTKTMVPKIVPSQVTRRVVAVPTAAPTVANGANTTTTSTTSTTSTTGTAVQPLQEVMHYTAPVSLSTFGGLSNKDHLQEVDDTSAVPDADCPICFRNLRIDGPVACPIKCGHTFHRSCIESSLGHSSKCPLCRQNITGELQGTMPTGTMVIKTNEGYTCSGYESGTLVINYSFDSGIQKPYHQNPGQPYSSTIRVAYLPDNQEGRKILKRLKFAFSSGLTFTVGTSLSTGMANSITWASIHHKNSLSGGRAHGFPDAGYVLSANEELDALGVPSSDIL